MARREDDKIGKCRVDELYIGSGLGIKVVPTAAQINLLVQGLAAGYKLARGSVNATASVTITTGLTTVVGFALTGEHDTATKANAAAAIGGKISSGNIVAYRYKHTNSTTNTLVAASTAGTIFWIAVGT